MAAEENVAAEGIAGLLAPAVFQRPACGIRSRMLDNLPRLSDS